MVITIITNDSATQWCHWILIPCHLLGARSLRREGRKQDDRLGFQRLFLPPPVTLGFSPGGSSLVLSRRLRIFFDQSLCIYLPPTVVMSPLWPVQGISSYPAIITDQSINFYLLCPLGQLKTLLTSPGQMLWFAFSWSGFSLCVFLLVLLLIKKEKEEGSEGRKEGKTAGKNEGRKKKQSLTFEFSHPHKETDSLEKQDIGLRLQDLYSAWGKS